MIIARNIGACGSRRHTYTHTNSFSRRFILRRCVRVRTHVTRLTSVHSVRVCCWRKLHCFTFFVFFFRCAWHAALSLLPSIENSRVARRWCAEEAVQAAERRARMRARTICERRQRSQGEGGGYSHITALVGRCEPDNTQKRMLKPLGQVIVLTKRLHVYPRWPPCASLVVERGIRI